MTHADEPLYSVARGGLVAARSDEDVDVEEEDATQPLLSNDTQQAPILVFSLEKLPHKSDCVLETEYATSFTVRRTD